MRKMLEERNLPELKTREEMLQILQQEEYGFLPEAPEALSFEQCEPLSRSYCAGKAIGYRMLAHLKLRGKHFSFPFAYVAPNNGKKNPFFIHINFRSDVPDRYMPTEEIVDGGFGCISFNYKDITTDDGDFTQGLAGILYPDGKRQGSDPGKIALWAWAAMRMMDFAETCDELDIAKAIVCGHSRLGKTALLTAALDTRFAIGYSNDSGCCGANLSRGTDASSEDVAYITNRFPYWFCPNYLAYANDVEKLPFDQHFLLASIAPRCVFVGSATLDAWANPLGEQLCCLAAAPAFEGGFLCDHIAAADEVFDEGRIGYHLRTGTHYFSRQDWQRLMAFAGKHL
jgi:hypothetical protein